MKFVERRVHAATSVAPYYHRIAALLCARGETDPIPALPAALVLLVKLPRVARQEP